MQIFIIGLVLFFGIHLLSRHPAKVGMKGKMGENGFKIAYSLISLIGFVFIILGYRSLPETQWFEPISLAQTLIFPVMAIALFVFLHFKIKTNILKGWQHPMMIGVLLWSGIHLLVTGTLASTILFGCFFLYSIWVIVLVPKQANLYKPVPRSRDIVLVLVWIILYIAILLIHPNLKGLEILTHQG